MKLFLLGVPVTSLSKEEAVRTISKLTEERGPYYIGTANIQFYATVYSLSLRGPRHPELLEILRRCRLVTADGMPLLWLSKLLGAPIKERVTGIDLALALCKTLRKPLYLLGGESALLKRAEKKLQKRFPQLIIAGSASPHIEISGEELADAEERDTLLLEELNGSGAGLLLLNLGHPKQEIWFERVRGRLQIPVSIGVGGSFKFIAGTVRRAPKRMQRWGLEWLWRLFQEPKHLWKRYLLCGAQFLAMAMPLLFVQAVNALLFRGRRGPDTRQSLLFLAQEKAASLLVFPRRLDKEAVRQLRHRVRDAFAQETVILDFRHLRHLNLYGISLLGEIWQHALAAKTKLYGISLSRNVRLLCKLHRIFDMLEPDLYAGPEDLLEQLLHERSKTLLYSAVDQAGPCAVITFFGRLDSHQSYGWHKAQLETVLRNRPCIVDMTYCSHIDNAGIGFLLAMNKEQEAPLKICGLNRKIKRELLFARAEGMFRLFPDLYSALEI